MSRPITLLFFLALCPGACGPAADGESGASSPAAGALPLALSCQEPVVDFGDVWEGAVLEHEFLVEMRSTEPGPIASARADCGCTVAKLEIEESAGGPRREYTTGESMPAGARIIVNTSYDTRGKVGLTPRTISLYGPSGVFRLELRANVIPWLTVHPERSDLGLLHERDSLRTTFAVESTNGTPFQLSYEHKSVPDQVTVNLTPVAESGTTRRDDGAATRASLWEVAVVLGPGMPRGPRGYPVQVQTDVVNEDSRPLPDGSRPLHSVTMWVSVNVVGAISLEPAHVIFGVVKGDETVARSIRLRSHDEDFTLEAPTVRILPPLELDAERDDVGTLRTQEAEGFALGRTATVATRRVPGENAWDIQVLLSGLEDGVPDNFRARLVIETGHPDEPRFESQITGIRMPGTR